MPNQKIRKKKYNPHKLKQAEQRKRGEILNPLYEFTAGYILEDVVKKLFSLSEEHGIEKGTTALPSFIVVEAYNEQDLILAVNLGLVETPQYWELAAETTYYNEDTEDIISVPFYTELPAMRFAELISPNSIKVDRGSGFKTRWQGLNTEIKNNIKSEKIPNTYTYVRTEIKMTAHARFKDMASYNQYNQYLKSRDDGYLIEALKVIHNLSNRIQ